MVVGGNPESCVDRRCRGGRSWLSGVNSPVHHVQPGVPHANLRGVFRVTREVIRVRLARCDFDDLVVAVGRRQVERTVGPHDCCPEPSELAVQALDIDVLGELAGFVEQQDVK